jgi:hypothetical protein
VTRVFNAPDIYSATYYGDSPLHTVNTTSKYVVSIRATTNELSAADSDGDGLIDRLEHYFGANMYDADSDDDGTTDGAEYRARTSPTSADSVLVLSSTVMSNGRDVTLTWPSVEGVRYEIDVTDDLTKGDDVYYTVSGIINGQDGTTSITLYNILSPDYPNRAFRVHLVE